MARPWLSFGPISRSLSSSSGSLNLKSDNDTGRVCPEFQKRACVCARKRYTINIAVNAHIAALSFILDIKIFAYPKFKIVY